MNFLAHLYLSGNDEEVMLGNFMADFVKARRFEGLSPGVIKGIEIHRHIDRFTDTHEIVHESKARLRPHYHKYASVITDMYYDHFLAANWAEFSDVPLVDFAATTYETLQRNRHVFPGSMERLLYYMVHENWLVSYAKVEGINWALQRMAKRTGFDSGMERAATELVQDYTLFKDEFGRFFPQLATFSRNLVQAPS